MVLVNDIAKKVLLPSSRRALFSVAIKSANRGGCGDDDHSHTNLLNPDQLRRSSRRALSRLRLRWGCSLRGRLPVLNFLPVE